MGLMTEWACSSGWQNGIRTRQCMRCYRRHETQSLTGHRESTPRAGEGLRAGVARLGRAALQSLTRKKLTLRASQTRELACRPLL
eukprot:scaffold60157_cov79-Phaeocystis_antarctica.AAC.2